ncbi:site-specific integrase [Sphingobium sp. Ndbn-10]|uniref:site-specific integrase n=1 Tax=Sphingobium sp. Ndbn-10 TaxID=1667223 RepID=UPI0008189E22|nr:site-specific integrase [Sphingobium sp. Ndbn-10]
MFEEPAPDPMDVALPLGSDLALLARGPDTRVAPELLSAYAAAAAPNSLRAFRSDVLSFDAWCRGRREQTVPARPAAIAAFLKDRGGKGAAPASLARCKASLAKLHKLCRLPDPTTDELVKLTLAALRREKGVMQKQARPLRFRGSVKDPLADPPRGLNLRATLAALGESLIDLRDKALLSVAYDTGAVHRTDPDIR